METEKAQIEALLSHLPDDGSADAQYHRHVLEQIHRGMESAETQPTLTQDEAEARLRKWLTQ